MRHLLSGIGWFALAALSVPTLALPSPAKAIYRQEAKSSVKTLTVKTSDGLSIAVREWGNPQGPEIVFIHGISQSQLSWSKQVESELARDFRLITYDLRGHGSSDKPLTPGLYQSSKAWADELESVLDATQAKRPVLVGWSYGGLIISDYLKIYGTKRLAGAVYLDAMIKMEAGEPSAASKALALMTSQDLTTNIEGTRAFLRTCFAKQPTPEEFETMLAFNMLTPAEVRKAMVTRVIDYDAVARGVRLPVLVIHGSADVPMPLAAAKHTAVTIPGARLSVFEGIGHSPFWEDAPRFNQELAAFVRQVNSEEGKKP